jgi:hypothetical protein
VGGLEADDPGTGDGCIVVAMLGPSYGATADANDLMVGAAECVEMRCAVEAVGLPGRMTTISSCRKKSTLFGFSFLRGPSRFLRSL